MQTQTKIKSNYILLSISLIIAFVALLTSPQVTYAKRLKPKEIKKTIAKGVEYIYKLQKPDGTWPESRGFKGGTTALAVYALLSAGESVKNPKIDKALKWMMDKKNAVPQIYTMGMRCNAFLQAYKQNKGKYKDALIKEATILLKAGVRGKGSYGYCLPGTKKKFQPRSHEHYHVSTAQYGVLGVWAGTECPRFEASMAFWNTCWRYWIREQHKDGGWAYDKKAKDWHGDPHASPAMTTAGIASLFLCFDRINQGKFLRCKALEYPKAIKRGLEWMNKTVHRDINRPDRFFAKWYTYYLYGLERVGLASGYKYFGKVDWYKEGTEKLRREQKPDGSWQYSEPGRQNEYSYLVDTSFCVLFLSRGLHPIGFNKLEFDGDWNNRPRDLAGLTRYISHMFESDIRWQIVNLKASVEELHDSPFLYISGYKSFKFNDQDAEKLKTYVYQGGTIVSVTECKGKEGFGEDIRKFYKKIFPEYKLKKLTLKHRIFNNIYKLKKYYNSKKSLKKKAPKVYAITNGARILAIHFETDVAAKWHKASGEGIKRLLKKKNKDIQHLQLMAPNVFQYIFGNFNKLTPRGTFFWPDLPSNRPSKSVKVAKLTGKGFVSDPEPLAFDKLNRLLQGVDHVALEVTKMPIEKIDFRNQQVATITGTGSIELNQKQRDALKKFVNDGGLLYVEAVGGNKKFAKSALKELKGMFGNDVKSSLDSNDGIYKFPGNKPVGYKKAARRRGAYKKVGALKGFKKNGKHAVLFSAYDLSVGIIGQPTGSIKGYDDRSSYFILRNIMLSRAK